MTTDQSSAEIPEMEEERREEERREISIMILHFASVYGEGAKKVIEPEVREFYSKRFLFRHENRATIIERAVSAYYSKVSWVSPNTLESMEAGEIPPAYAQDIQAQEGLEDLRSLKNVMRRYVPGGRHDYQNISRGELKHAFSPRVQGTNVKERIEKLIDAFYAKTALISSPTARLCHLTEHRNEMDDLL